jgi:hypothetical protein
LAGIGCINGRRKYRVLPKCFQAGKTEILPVEGVVNTKVETINADEKEIKPLPLPFTVQNWLPVAV